MRGVALPDGADVRCFRRRCATGIPIPARPAHRAGADRFPLSTRSRRVVPGAPLLL